MQQKPQYAEPTYKAPYRGWNSQAPAMLIPPSDNPFVSNFLFRNSEIISCPKLNPSIPYPETTQPIVGLNTFRDTNGVAHTVAITPTALFQLVLNRDSQRWIWNRVDSFNGVIASYQTRIYLNQLYWTTCYPGVYYWDGMTGNIKVASPDYGGKFLGEIGYHLLLLNTSEIENGGVVNYPQRIRWTPSGIVNTWNPATNPGAGYTDIIDVPDAITGFMSIGRYGYVFRNNGITHINQTGNGLNPFMIDHMWASENGIGNVFPYSVSSYGSAGCFVSEDEIYKISMAGFEPIGLGARDRILAELDDASSEPSSCIVPGYSRKFVYMTYNLIIPKDSATIIWIYNIEDKNWTRRVINDLVITGPIKNVYVR